MATYVAKEPMEITLGSQKMKLIRVLHVDDDSGLLQIAKEILELNGLFEVQNASSVEEAFEKISQEKYDAVVSDYQMPGKDGLEFLKELREKGNTIPFVIFTGKGREEVAVKALNLGADGYFNKAGSPETVYGELFHGIRQAVEKKKANDALRESEERFKAIVENAPFGYYQVGKDGLWQYVNPVWERMHGFSFKEVVGKSFEITQPEGSVKQAKELVKRALSGESLAGEFGRLTKEGKIEYHSYNIQPIKHGKEVVAIEGFINDISERKKAEQALKRSEVRFRDLTESISDVFFAMDNDLRYTYWNRASEKLTGISAKETIGKSLTEVFPDVKDTEVEQFYRNVLRTKHHQTFVNKYRVKEKDFIFEIDAYPTKDGISVFTKDITEHKHTEETLRQSEERFRQLFSSMPSGVAIYEAIDNGKDFVFKDFNAAAEKIEKISKDNVLGKRVTQMFTGVKSFGLFEVFQRVRRTGQSEYFPAALYKDDKNQGTWRENWIYKLPNGNIIAIYNDITQRKRAEENLRQSEEKYRSLFESTQDGIAISDAKGIVVSANQAAAIMHGYKNAEELVNTPAVTLYADPQDRRVLFELLAKKGTVKDYEVKLKRKDGTTFDARVTVVLQRDVQGNVLRSESIFRDITERKKAKEELRASEERYRTLYEAVSGGVVAQDQNGVIIEANNTACEILGLTQDQIRGRTSFDPQWHAIRKDGSPFPGNEHPAMVALHTGKPVRNGVMGVFHPTEGAYRWIQINAEPRLDPATGHVKGVVTTFLDISERKITEESLEKEQHELDCIIDSSPIIIFYKDKEGQFIRVNKTFAETLKIPKEEFLGKTVFDLYSAKIAQGMTNDDSEVLKSGRPKLGIIEQYESASGIRWVQTDKVPIFDKNGIPAGLVGFAQDITERKKAEEALRLSEEKHRAISSITADCLFSCVKAGKEDFAIDWMAGAAEKVFGYSIEEIKRRGCWKFVVTPKDLSIFEEKVAGLKPGQFSVCELRITHKDGSTRWIKVSSQVTKDSSNPTNHRLFGACRDITERKKAEKHLKESHYKMEMINEKLRVVGALTRHDVRNKLSAVEGNVHLAKKKLAAESGALSYLSRIESTIDQITEIFNFATAYERIGLEKLVYVDAEKAVKEAVSLFSDLQSVKISNDCHGLSVLADSLLNQLFFNLIDNSLKHGKQTSQIRIYYQKENGGNLRLVYEDDGVGIPYAEKPKLFKEGHSTAGGTGYGLYLIKKLTEVYGWTIQETGEPCKGAKFTITIPKKNQDNEESYQLLST